MLLGLVGWMALQVHRQLVSRTRRWVLYPLLAALALTSIGGGYETVRESIDAAAHPVSGQDHSRPAGAGSGADTQADSVSGEDQSRPAGTIRPVDGSPAQSDATSTAAHS